MTDLPVETIIHRLGMKRLEELLAEMKAAS